MSNIDWSAAAALSWYGTGSKDDLRNGPLEGWLFHCKPEVFLGAPSHQTCGGNAPGLPIAPLRSGEGAPHCGQGRSVGGREALQYVHNIVTHPLSCWHPRYWGLHPER